MARRPKENRLKRGRGSVLKATGLVLVVGLVSSALYAGYIGLTEFMSLREVVISGNRVVPEEEILQRAGLRKGLSLLEIDREALRQRLLELNWFGSVSIRKEPPWRLIIKVREKSPVAILKKSDGLYLVDRRGRIIERTEEGITLLPVIDVPVRDSATLEAAIKLAEALRDDGHFDGRSLLIQGRSPETITLLVDGLRIFMGSRHYRRKLEKLVEIERVLRQRAIEAEYVDLRFRERAIVRTRRVSVDG